MGHEEEFYSGRPNYTDSTAKPDMPKRKKTSNKVLNAVERTGLGETTVKLLFRDGWTLRGRSPKNLVWVAPVWLPQQLKEIAAVKKRMQNNG